MLGIVIGVSSVIALLAIGTGAQSAIAGQVQGLGSNLISIIAGKPSSSGPAQINTLAHLTLNVTDYYSNQNQRDLVVGLADYLAKKLETIRPEEASAARVLRDLVKNQRLG